jgi:hypothetical protein
MPRVETDYTVLGKPLAKTGPTTLTMAQSDYRDVLSELGVTPEVRETVHNAEEKLAAAAYETIRTYLPTAAEEHQARIKEAKAAVKAGTANGTQKTLAEQQTPPEIVINLGSGDGKMTCAVATKVEHNGHNPHTGADIHTVKFGVPKLVLRHAVPKILQSDDGILAQIRADCEKLYGK